MAGPHCGPASVHGNGSDTGSLCSAAAAPSGRIAPNAGRFG